VFAQFLPAEFRQALQMSQTSNSSLHEALRKTVGVDHAVVGAMLVEKWRFAPELINTISHQYEANKVDTSLFACVFTANQISKQLGFGFGGNPCIHTLPEQVARRMRGTLDEVIAASDDWNSIFEDAKLFAKL